MQVLSLPCFPDQVITRGWFYVMVDFWTDILFPANSTHMKFIIVFCSQLYFGFSLAQSPVSTNNFVEGGKVLVELVKIFKKNPGQQITPGLENNSSDLCFTNSTVDNLFVELSKKINDSTYKNLPGTISLTAKAHECLLGLSATVYHYKVYKKINGAQVLSLEGELRLLYNEKMEREIK